MKIPKMRFTAVGDVLIQKRLPGRYEGFAELEREIGQGDFRFFNLETTIHNWESYGAQCGGGSWLCAPPESLEDVKQYGFNITSSANNHSMDFSYGGLLKTVENVRKAGLPNAGTGPNLTAAAAPVYLDTLAGRVALIAAVSTFEPYAMAGEQSVSMEGRPGVNGLRVETSYGVSKEQMEALRGVAQGTAINGQDDIIRAEGYLPPVPEGSFYFGGLLFQERAQGGKTTKVHEADRRRVEKAIFEASLQADYIVVSVHSHEVKGVLKTEPDFFLEEFARGCIDCGAHAVVGHGPHLLRPVEIYRGRPIFYSLGDFIFHNENIPKAPADFFAGYGLPSDATMHRLFQTRSKDFQRGLQTKREMFETVIPTWEMEDGVLTKLKLLAVELGFGLPRSRSGWPVAAQGSAILERLAEMSERYGTKMKIQGNRGEILL